MEMNGLDDLASIIPLSHCDGNADRPCIDQIKSTIAKVAREVGYSRWTYTQFSCVDASQEYIPSTFLSTIDTDWQQRYIDMEYHRIDPVVRCADPSSGVFVQHATWEQCKNICLDAPIGVTARQKNSYKRKVRDFYIDAASYGYISGVVLSASIGFDRVTCSGSSQLPVDEHEAMINDYIWKRAKTAVIIVHQLVDLTMGCALCGKGEHVNFSISEPEARWLQAALDNPFSTNYELAAKSARSVETMKSQMTSLRKKLGLPRANPFVLALYCKRNGLLAESPFRVITDKDKSGNVSCQEGCED